MTAVQLLQHRDLSALPQADGARLFLDWLAREQQVLAWGDAFGLDRSVLGPGQWAEYQQAFTAVAEAVLTSPVAPGLLPSWWEPVPAVGVTTRYPLTPGGVVWADWVARVIGADTRWFPAGGHWAAMDAGPTTARGRRYRPALVVPGADGRSQLVDLMELTTPFAVPPGTSAGRAAGARVDRETQALLGLARQAGPVAPAGPVQSVSPIQPAEPAPPTRPTQPARPGWRDLRTAVAAKVREGVDAFSDELSRREAALNAGQPTVAPPREEELLERGGELVSVVRLRTMPGLRADLRPSGPVTSAHVRALSSLWQIQVESSVTPADAEAPGNLFARFTSWLLEQPGILDVEQEDRESWSAWGEPDPDALVEGADAWWADHGEAGADDD